MNMQRTTFEHVFEMIDVNGLYVCEDLATSYVTQFGGLPGITAPKSKSMVGLGNVDNKSSSTIIGEITASDIPNLSTSKITSGTFADARIAASNVTQHLGTAGTLNVGISENNIAQFTTSVSDNYFLKIDGTKVEGRSVSEV